MKVLLINKFHYLKGGAERCYFNTAKILNKHGHDTAFFSMKHPANRQSRWSKYFIDNIDYNQANNLTIKIKAIFNIFYNFQAKKNLQRLINEFKPDIAHLHNIYHQISPSIIHTLKKNKIPIVMTLHDYKLICPNYNLLVRGKIWEKSKKHKYYKCFFDKCVKNSYLKSLVCVIEAYLHRVIGVYKKIDLYISPSYFLMEKFKEFGFEKKIIYLPNPLLAGVALQQTGIKEKERYILYFGRLSPEKGVADLISAFSFLEGIDCKLYIVGDGPDKLYLEKMIKDKKLENKIKLLGFKYNKKLWEILNGANAVVVPSKWYENAPYSLLEALGLGKILIVAGVGGLKELIENKKNGFLYDYDNIDNLKNIIKEVLNYNQDELAGISQKAIQSVLSRNDPEKYYERLNDLYEEVISKN